MGASLDGCLAKLCWADGHIEELERDISDYIVGNPCELGINFDETTLEGFVYVQKLAPPKGMRWGLIIGDIGHNLRSALDHLACQLARLKDPSHSCKQTQFPIFNDQDRYLATGKWKGRRPGRNYIDALNPADSTEIDLLQPYDRTHPNNMQLWLLSKINDIDKHRILHPVVVGVLRSGIGITSLRGLSMISENVSPPGEIHEGAVLGRFQLLRHGGEAPDLKMNPHITVKVCFGQGESPDLAGKDVVDTIRGIRSFVNTDIVPRFKNRFP